VRLAIKTGAQQVRRGEVHDAIEKANRSAAASVIDEESFEALGTEPTGVRNDPRRHRTGPP